MADVGLLIERLRNATLVDDQIDILNSVKAATESDGRVFDIGDIPILLEKLREHESEPELSNTILEILTDVVGDPHDINTDACKALLSKASYVESLLRMLGASRTWVRQVAAQLLTTVGNRFFLELGAVVAKSQQGLENLMAALSDEDEPTRNDVLLLLRDLTLTNNDVRSFVAFSDGFERLASIIHKEMGSGAEDSMIVVDCFAVTSNILRGLAVTRKVFGESAVIKQLPQFLAFDRSGVQPVERAVLALNNEDTNPSRGQGRSTYAPQPGSGQQSHQQRVRCPPVFSGADSYTTALKCANRDDPVGYTIGAPAINKIVSTLDVLASFLEISIPCRASRVPNVPGNQAAGGAADAEADAEMQKHRRLIEERDGQVLCTQLVRQTGIFSSLINLACSPWACVDLHAQLVSGESEEEPVDPTAELTLDDAIQAYHQHPQLLTLAALQILGVVVTRSTDDHAVVEAMDQVVVAWPDLSGFDGGQEFAGRGTKPIAFSAACVLLTATSPSTEIRRAAQAVLDSYMHRTGAAMQFIGHVIAPPPPADGSDTPATTCGEQTLTLLSRTANDLAASAAVRAQGFGSTMHSSGDSDAVAATAFYACCHIVNVCLISAPDAFDMLQFIRIHQANGTVHLGPETRVPGGRPLFQLLLHTTRALIPASSVSEASAPASTTPEVAINPHHAPRGFSAGSRPAQAPSAAFTWSTLPPMAVAAMASTRLLATMVKNPPMAERVFMDSENLVLIDRVAQHAAGSTSVQAAMRAALQQRSTSKGSQKSTTAGSTSSKAATAKVAHDLASAFAGGAAALFLAECMRQLKVVHDTEQERANADVQAGAGSEAPAPDGFDFTGLVEAVIHRIGVAAFQRSLNTIELWNRFLRMAAELREPALEAASTFYDLGRESSWKSLDLASDNDFAVFTKQYAAHALCFEFSPSALALLQRDVGAYSILYYKSSASSGSADERIAQLTEEYEERLAAKDSSLAAVNTELDAMREQLREAEQKLDLRARLESDPDDSPTDSAAHELQDQLSEARLAEAAALAQARDSTAQCDSLKQRLAEAQARISDLEQQAPQEPVSEGGIAEVEDLRQRLARSEKLVVQLEEDLEAASSATAAPASTTDDVEALKKKIHDMTADTHKHTQLAIQLEETRDLLQAQVEELQAKLRSEKERFAVELNELQDRDAAETNELHGQIEELETLAQATLDSEAAAEQLTSLKAELEECRHTIEELKQELDAARDAAAQEQPPPSAVPASTTDDVEALKKKIHDMTADKHKHTQLAIQLEETRDLLQAQVEELQAKLRSEKERFAVELNELQDEHAAEVEALKTEQPPSDAVCPPEHSKAVTDLADLLMLLPQVELKKNEFKAALASAAGPEAVRCARAEAQTKFRSEFGEEVFFDETEAETDGTDDEETSDEEHFEAVKLPMSQSPPHASNGHTPGTTAASTFFE